MELLGRGWDREPLADVGDALRRGPLGQPPNHTVDARPAVGNDDAPTPEFDAWRRERVQRAVRNLRGLLAGRLVRSAGGEIAQGGEMPAAFARAALCSTVRPRLELGSLDPLPQLLPWLGFAVGDLTTGSEAAVALEEVFVADRTGDVTGDPTELAVDLRGARVGRRLYGAVAGQDAAPTSPAFSTSDAAGQADAHRRPPQRSASSGNGLGPGELSRLGWADGARAAGRRWHRGRVRGRSA